MASVDDIKELIATRRLNGVDDGLFKSDKNVANDKDYTLAYLKGYADAEEKYRKKIKELEVLEDDLKDKRVVYIDTPEFAEKFISTQKVVDKMEKLNKEIKNGDEVEAIFKIKQQQILQELLEDK